MTRLALRVTATAASALSQDLTAWDRALKSHVSPGVVDGIDINLVDYVGMAYDPGLSTFVRSLSDMDVHKLTEDETLAIFINAYNALAIKLIVDHPCQYSSNGTCLGPIVRIGHIDNVWDRPAGTIGGQTYSLAEIESFLRSPPKPFRADPRIHACIVCASLSCPDLRIGAFRPDVVRQQMEEQMSKLLDNSQKGLLIDRTRKTVTASKLFSMYPADFGLSDPEDFESYVLPYLARETRRFLLAEHEDLQQKFFEWNPILNGKAPCSCGAAMNEYSHGQARGEPGGENHFLKRRKRIAKAPVLLQTSWRDEM